MKTTRVSGHVAVRSGRPAETDKAVRVTVDSINGEAAQADTAWLPRSLCTNLQIKRVVEDGTAAYEFSAEVESWWVSKLDTRTAWQRQGMRSAPMAARPV